MTKHITPAYYNEATDDGLGYNYIYNEMNQLLQIINEQGEMAQSFTYNALGQIVAITDSKGYTTYQTYDLLGNLLEKRVPVEVIAGEVRYQLTRYTYDSEGNKLTEQQGCDLVGEKDYASYYHTLTFDYDRVGRLISVKDGHGAKVTYRYNCLSQKTYENFKISEKVERTIHYRYDYAGQLIEKKEELDQQFLTPQAQSKSVWAITEYIYDKNGNLIKEVSPKGYITEKAYDALDQVISQYEIDKQNGIYRKWQYNYDPAGRLTESIDITTENAKKTCYTYDVKDRLTHYTDVLGQTTRLFYDTNDRIVKEVLPAQYDAQLDDGPGTTYSYNFQDKVTTTHNALGELVSEMSYNSHGELVTVQNGAHEKVSYTYNLLGQMKEIITPNSGAQNRTAQTYHYDARGNITGIVDGNGNATRYDLDEWGRIVQIITPEGGTERYTYDFAGNITSTTDANGGTITYKYNNQGKVCEITDQEGLSDYFYYDEEGNVSCHIDREGNRVTTAYNRDGNIVFRQGCDAGQDGVITESFKYYPDGMLSDARTKGMAYHYTYTLDGNLESKSASGRTLLAYAYTPNNKIASIQDVTGKSTHYSYDMADRTQHIADETGKSLATYSYGANQQLEKIVYGNGIASTYSYDGDQNVKSLVTVTPTGEVLVDYKYAYDLNGNRFNKVGSKHQVYYSYDKMNRLTEASYDGRQESFTYDRVGNRLTKTTNGVTEKYCYNVKNQLKELHQNSGITYFTYSPQGNTIKEATPIGSNNYSYNAFNQQIKAEMQNGDTLISRYDAEGLRHEIEENERLVKFIFHKDNVLIETDGEDSCISRLARGYEVVGAEIRNEDKYNTYYYSPDEQGSTLFITDDEGKVANSYFYDAFGNVLNSEELVHNRITYVGQQFDGITQQYYLRARYYNPVIGRFTQEDIYRGDGLNLYAYCANNPIIYYDFSGYATCSASKQRQLRSNPDSYYSYKELKKLIKQKGLSGRSGKGLEAHHMLEKQFAHLFGVNKEDIISVALTPQWHRNVRSAIGNNIDNLIDTELDKILKKAGKNIETATDVWQAHKNVYLKINQLDWAEAIYEKYVKKLNIPF